LENKRTEENTSPKTTQYSKDTKDEGEKVKFINEKKVGKESTKKAKSSVKSPTLLFPLFRVFYLRLLFAAFLKLLRDLLAFIPPLVLE
jgi:hypothetical protein